MIVVTVTPSAVPIYKWGEIIVRIALCLSLRETRLQHSVEDTTCETLFMGLDDTSDKNGSSGEYEIGSEYAEYCGREAKVPI
jgi:hypothetical protein